MIKKLSGADKRLFCAILAVFLLTVASTPFSACEDCEIFSIKVTFVDTFNKADYFLFVVLLPNAVAIVTNTKKNQGFKSEKITLKSGEQKTVTLDGQSVYAYTIFELEWNLQKLDALTTTEVISLIASGNYNDYTKATRCIDTGVILDDTTITF